jgi:hypothetical protein
MEETETCKRRKDTEEAVRARTIYKSGDCLRRRPSPNPNSLRHLLPVWMNGCHHLWYEWMDVIVSEAEDSDDFTHKLLIVALSNVTF